MKKWLFFWLLAVLLMGLRGNARAHFAMIIPSDSMIEEGEPREVRVTLSFSHPFKGEGMELEKPFQFGVVTGRWKRASDFCSKGQGLWATRDGWLNIGLPGVASTPFTWSRNPILIRLKIVTSFTTQRPWLVPQARTRAGINPWASRQRSFL